MRARVLRPMYAGTLNRNTIRQNAAAAWCQVALRTRRMPGSITNDTASQRLAPAIHAHQFAGSQVEMTSYQASSGASSWAVLRAKRKSIRAGPLNASSHRARSQARIAGPVRPSFHSALPRF